VHELLEELDLALDAFRLPPHALISADKKYRNAGQKIDARRDVEMRVLGYASPNLVYTEFDSLRSNGNKTASSKILCYRPRFAQLSRITINDVPMTIPTKETQTVQTRVSVYRSHKKRSRATPDFWGLKGHLKAPIPKF
jgi:hypothetical protein